MEEIKQWPIATLNEFSAINNQPIWKGFYTILLDTSHAATLLAAPWFVKISQGEVWRLWTPCILHGGFLHILFNMLWLWLLGRQVEFKLGIGRYILGMLVIGVLSNTAQYLMSGALFLGYSGVISGLGGFIWVRQKLAPWEGYMVPKATLLFLFVFIVGMVLLQTGVFVINKFHLGDFVLGGVGNTSHVVGLLTGMLLAKIPAFYRLKT
jgi:GlpG protein